jgi:putative restriction endonuclease
VLAAKVLSRWRWSPLQKALAERPNSLEEARRDTPRTRQTPPVDEDLDRRVRLAAFDFLRKQSEVHGEVLPRQLLQQGFAYGDVRVPLVGPQGIFKPAVLRSGIPLSITTVPLVAGRDRPYEDEVGPDGLLRYRYRGVDPRHHENEGLRRAMTTNTPLVYFHGIEPGKYLPQWPAFIVGDNPGALTFTVAMDEPQALRGDLTSDVVEDVRRMYVTRLARHRLHQVAFRERVLRAYRESCAMCRLRHRPLLDAAHILPDGHPRGEPVVSNGLALCKLHHSAFDANIVGVRPDHVIEVRHDILGEVDGPMLKHGLQSLHGGRLAIVPRAKAQQPSAESLAERYQAFRDAG